MKDYSRRMHENEDGGFKTDNRDRYISISHVEAYIHKACAEAIADTRKAERRRAARIVKMWNSLMDDDCIVEKILGREKRRAK